MNTGILVPTWPPPSSWSPPRWAAPSVAAALVVAAARVGTGVHYPHDVLTGLAVGAGVVAVAALVLDRPVRALLHAAAGRWPASVARS